MKPLIKIILVAALLFVVFGIAQSWRSFFRVAPETTASDPKREAAALQAVRGFVSMASHAYRSGGDPRFVERLPASDAVKAELADELRYLEQNGRVQMSELTRLEALEVELLSPARAIVRTQEDWVAHQQRAADGARLTPDRMHVAFVEYRLELSGGGWRVVGWELIPPPAPPDDGAARQDG